MKSAGGSLCDLTWDTDALTANRGRAPNPPLTFTAAVCQPSRLPVHRVDCPKSPWAGVPGWTQLRVSKPEDEAITLSCLRVPLPIGMMAYDSISLLAFHWVTIGLRLSSPFRLV